MNTTLDDEKARGFIRSLEEAEEIYLRLLGLTRNQSQVLRDGVSPELLELARAKEEELRNLNDLERRLAPAREDWVGMRQRVGDELRHEVQGVIGRVESILRELLELEEKEGRSLAARRDETISEIRRIDAARKVRGAYGGGAPRPALLDQKE